MRSLHSHSHFSCFYIFRTVFQCSFCRFSFHSQSTNVLFFVFFAFLSFSLNRFFGCTSCLLRNSNTIHCIVLTLSVVHGYFSFWIKIISFNFCFIFQNADDTMAVDYPNSATIFAAACACIFIVIGVAGKSAQFKWNWKPNNIHIGLAHSNRKLGLFIQNFCFHSIGFRSNFVVFLLFILKLELFKYLLNFNCVFFFVICLYRSFIFSLSLFMYDIKWKTHHRQSNYDYRFTSTSKTPGTCNHRFCSIAVHIGFAVLFDQHAIDCPSVYV